MADNKMLIDATHPEETRVVVLRSGRVEEFDYESAARKLLRGNIYLAKVTRVEPALQAAFVDYGGNRHGFLAFNEIHPDYYQIPVADRIALIEEEAAAEAEEEAQADARAEAMASRRRRRRRPARRGGSNATTDAAASDASSDEDASDASDTDAPENEAAADIKNTGETTGEDNQVSANNADPDADITQADTTADASVEETGEQEKDAGGEPTEDGDGPSVISAAMAGDDSISEAPSDDTDDAEVEIVEEASNADTEQDTAAEQPEALDDEPVDDQDTEGEPEVLEAAGDQDADPDTDEANDGDDTADDGDANGDAEAIDEVGTEDALEEMAVRPRRSRRSYKIQEVIKRRQVLLIQVVKEERGNKGAALTTYLSLAGRYTVLMPNTARGGGISRKITNAQDRKRLKAIAADLEVPEGMGLIIRTAGAARTDAEIRRDFEYLLRLWESVREMTLQSTAPSLVYEEGNLIKRSIRDLYNKDVDQVIVAGKAAHRDAKEFMGMLMPSHADNVILYNRPDPLFTSYQIERQLNAMFSPYVTLKSGGYLVINQTEALVAVDVNSGRSTREFSIEETALNTNLEAASEIARQLKLRDLAGLIVIDFIDMEERRNNRAVERRMKDALRLDRARIQVGHISHFGLMEMSRQRMRTGVLEGSTSQCEHCQGTGIIRSTESVALAVLRGLEDAVMAGSRAPLVATAAPEVALYILNKKRDFVIDMENRLGLPVSIEGSEKQTGANFTIEKGAAVQSPQRRVERNVVNMDWGFEDGEEGSSAATVSNDESAEQPRSEDGVRRKRRRRRRGRRDDAPAVEASENADSDDAYSNGDDEGAANDEAQSENGISADGREDDTNGEETTRRRGRRRGRRGGRRGRERRTAATEVESVNDNEAALDSSDSASDIPGTGPQPGSVDQTEASTSPAASDEAVTGDAGDDQSAERKPRPSRRRPRRRKTADVDASADQGTSEAPDTNATVSSNADDAARVEPADTPEPQAEPDNKGEEQSKTARNRGEPTSSTPRIERVTVGPNSDQSTQSGEATAPPPQPSTSEPTRKGWWQRRFLSSD